MRSTDHDAAGHIRPVIAGLSMQMNTDGGNNGYVLGGPAIYAALGIRHAGLAARLVTAIGNDLDEQANALLRFIDPDPVRLTTMLARPMIAWNSPAILGDHGKGKLTDDPARWRAMPSTMDALKAQPLILANGDPEWHQSLLAAARPSLVFMDVHMEWLRFREKALNVCMQQANVITITEAEYKALPVAARSGGIFSGDNKALVIKRGSLGITILANRESRDFPPPTPCRLGTDVGCGDFLIGLLAGHALSSSEPVSALLSVDRLGDAYLASLAALATLIESDSPSAFVQHSIRTIGAQKDSQ